MNQLRSFITGFCELDKHAHKRAATSGAPPFQMFPDDMFAVDFFAEDMFP